MPIITLTTDFGERDGYPGVMKGVMLRYNPNLRFVDITHSIRPFGIKEAAFVLKNAYSYFPKGTLHLVIVDPTVGGKRRPIIVKSKGYLFIGPDNGVFSYIYDKGSSVYEIIPKKLPVKSISSTFHGRDVFAVMAGLISQGREIEEFAEPLKDFISFPLPNLRREGKEIYGEVLYIDGFGNLITNIEKMEGQGHFEIEGERIPIKSSYEEVERGRPLAILGSSGYYELSIREGRASEALRLRIGDEVKYVKDNS